MSDLPKPPEIQLCCEGCGRTGTPLNPPRCRCRSAARFLGLGIVSAIAASLLAELLALLGVGLPN